MTKENVEKAIAIISQSNEVTVKFNAVVGESKKPSEIVLVECNASLIQKLGDEEFSMYLTKQGIALEKF